MSPRQSFAEGGLFASHLGREVTEMAALTLERWWGVYEKQKKTGIPYMEANFLGRSAEFKVEICDYPIWRLT